MKSGKTFSESWHRVAGLRVSLRPTVEMRRQYFRGEKWYVLQDPFNNQFFRIRPAAYEFLTRLRADRTVEEVWQECLQRTPEEAPGQEDLIQLLVQLHYANLLYSDTPAASAKLFERYKKRRQREIQSKLLSIMFVRIPLFDPERILRKLSPIIKYIVSPGGALVWFIVVILALKNVADHFDEVWDQAQGIIAPENLFLLYLGLVIVKTIHELGHAVVCKKYGGEVHTMGVMLLVFTPLPYMDATASWAFRSHWRRALVGGAGMIAEIFIAALATFVWVRTGPGIPHNLAYNMMFIASVSTVLFNINPLLRFDGYYILSDVLDLPNLHTRATRHLRHLVERYLFGVRQSVSPSESYKESFWLTTFGILSGIYRVVVFTGIILFVADKFLLFGVLMAATCVVSWGIVPVFRLFVYLTSNERLARNRPRAIFVCVSLIIFVVLAVGVIPFPDRFRAPGVVEAVQYAKVMSEVEGYVRTVNTPSGQEVTAGTPLVTLANHELELEIESTAAQLEETEAMLRRSLFKETANLKPFQKRLEAIESRMDDLETQKESLAVRARKSGIWVSPELNSLVGSWLSRGQNFGEIVNTGSFMFTAVVSQEDAANLFAEEIIKAEVRIFGEAGKNIEVSDYQIIPFQHEKLPSAALGWFGGGEVAVSTSDQSGLKTAEPFFQIYAFLKEPHEVRLMHGRSGKLRFTMNSKPLLYQWVSSLRQLLQRRYQI